MNPSQSLPALPARNRAADERPLARFLAPHDIAALLDLEREKWTEGQAATAAELQQRITAFPNLSLGSFCPRSGRLMASLFMKPVPDDFARRADCWHSALALRVPLRSHSLFGISLSSRAPEGVDALLEFFWPISLHMGWRHIYLGSPVPGLSAWLSRHPSQDVADYVHAKRGGLPLDPQLRYYHGRGFTRIVAVKPGYFPHDRSLNYGVLLRGTIPLSSMSSLWRRMPLSATQSLTGRLMALL